VRRHREDCAHCAAVSRPHRPGCRHCRRVRQLGRDYRAWRAAAEAARQAVCIGYATEEAAYGNLPTFRDYLEGMAA
jgi:hypothetical protein